MRVVRCLQKLAIGRAYCLSRVDVTRVALISREDHVFLMVCFKQKGVYYVDELGKKR